jgi:hypothetical protein
MERIRRNGAPVILSSAPWSEETKEKRFARGPHNSAHEFVEFLGEEFLDFVKKGYWMLLPYEDVKDMVSVQYSPLGVVPQRERRPRVIVDYSFFGVNNDTLKLGPEDAMQFGKAVERLLQTAVRANPKFGPLLQYKLDISDGFYRISLSTSGIPKLGVLLPEFPGLPPLVAFPLVLPMGWTDSPPFFCLFTETICDLTNEELRKNVRYPEHPLEKTAGALDFADCEPIAASAVKPPVNETTDITVTALLDNTVTPISNITRDPHKAGKIPRTHLTQLRHKPTAYMDVFVDDFCGEGQDSRMNPIQNQRRALFHTVDKVFRPNDTKDTPSRKEPISISKLEKGDAAFHDKKRFLGWDFEGSTRQLLVAPHRWDKALLHLEELLSKQTSNRKEWERLLGELRSLVPGIAGSKGQFSVMQEGISKGRNRIKVRGKVRHQLKTMHALVASTTRPSSMYELVLGPPPYLGATDAAKAGMGGVWFIDSEALLWRSPFPEQVQSQLVSQKNPTGKVTNSDLELLGTMAHHHVLEESGYPMAGESTHTLVITRQRSHGKTRAQPRQPTSRPTSCVTPRSINGPPDTSQLTNTYEVSETSWQMMPAVCGN